LILDVDRKVLFALYRELLAEPDSSPLLIRRTLGIPEDTLRAVTGMLLDLGLLTEAPATASGVSASPPEGGLGRMLALEEQSARRRLADVTFISETVRLLVEELASQQTRRVNVVHAEVLTGRGEIHAALEEAAQVVQREVVSMHPGPVLNPDALVDGQRRDREVLSRGVSMRSIHLAAMTRTPYAAAHLDALRDGGAHVRLAPTVPFRLIIIDGTLAFTPISFAGPGPDTGNSEATSVLVSRGYAITQLLRRVFEHCWLTATPMPSTDDCDTAALTEQQQWMLRMLDTGAKDEVVARELGVSVRTFRRLMADLMQKLGIVSRFQAGAQARRRGYLP
jgi:DNA-binding CsgD family transcriptional regulator